MIHIRFSFRFNYTSIANAMWKAAEGKIKSKWAKTVNPENVWREYPRPQFERSNGKTHFGIMLF